MIPSRPTPTANALSSMLGYPLVELRELLHKDGHPAFRADQLFNWMHARRVLDPARMSNLSGSLKAELGGRYPLMEIEPLRRATSGNSDCEKILFGLKDGKRIEAVWMGFESRSTLCVSTQVGCALDCAFCATATMGFVRHLDAGEIVQQVLWVHSRPGREISNLVFMGMGEPLHNYEQVCRALRILNDDRGMALGRRRMTVSTAGLVPQILRLAEDDVPCRLAVSLNAASDEKRSRLMPINRKYPLDVLFDACKSYTELSGDRVTFEYILMAGVNDGAEDIRLLKSRLSRLPSKLNLIYYNQTDRGFASSAESTYQRFFEALQHSPFPVTLRKNMGTDIDAACGQLAVKEAEREQA